VSQDRMTATLFIEELFLSTQHISERSTMSVVGGGGKVSDKTRFFCTIIL
jgi:hypothetical protein